MSTSSWYPELYEESNSWDQIEIPMIELSTINDISTYTMPLILGLFGVCICGSLLCYRLQRPPTEQLEQLIHQQNNQNN